MRAIVPPEKNAGQAHRSHDRPRDIGSSLLFEFSTQLVIQKGGLRSRNTWVFEFENNGPTN
jgi:hypothetical protein